MTAPTAPPATLGDHQQKAIDFIVSHPHCGIWLDMGGGKSLSTLVALQRIRPIGHILVIAPVAIARSVWIDEIKDWGFPIRTRSLIRNDNDKKLTRAKRLERYEQVFSDPPTMYFINQELVDDLVDNMPTRAVVGSDGRRRKQIQWPFRTVIIDESQGFKSHDSNRFKALRRVRSQITRTIELTGTPTPNGLHDLWAQIFLLDGGAALGRTITEFRERWFTPEMIPSQAVPVGWIPNPGAEQEIYAAISHLVMSAKNTSLVLPEVSVDDVKIRLPAGVMNAYKDFKRNLVIDVVDQNLQAAAEVAFDQWLAGPSAEAAAMVAELDALDGDERAHARSERLQDFLEANRQSLVTTVVAENQAVLTSKLMQYASGTLYTADPDDPATKGRYEVVHTEKLAMVEHLVHDGGDRPVLLAYHFRSDLEQLLTHLKKAGIDARAFDGSREMVRQWNAREILVMLVHPASAGHGLNLQHGGSTLIWYTLPFSLEHYLQTNKRLHRPGQKEPVRILRLLARGTHDERMPGVLGVKKQVQDDLLAAVSVDPAPIVASRLQAATWNELAEDISAASAPAA